MNRLKKIIISGLLALSVLLSFSSCKFPDTNSSFDSAFDYIDEKVIEIIDNNKSVPEKGSKSSFDKTDSESSNKTDSASKSKKTQSNKKTVNKSVKDVEAKVTVKEKIISDEKIEEPKTANIESKSLIAAEHSALSESQYYQFSNLNAKEKRLYQKIVDAIKNSNSIVYLTEFGACEENVLKIFQMILADYPQFFYLSRNCMLMYNSFGNNVRALILLYCDGSVTDEFDKAMHLKSIADRNKINEQISEFLSKTNNALETIPSTYSDILKEKMIHDYIAENVIYDTNAAENIDEYQTTVPHSFDVYGAAVEGLAVCEGYAKLFQYMCYNVGINSGQVYGTSYGYEHMWNTVLINKKWYFVDVTWDDSGSIGYSYFNITEEKLSADHEADSSSISVPVCNCTDDSFINNFAVQIKDVNSAPLNYEKVFGNIKLLGEKRVFLYFENFKKDKNGYINAGLYANYIKYRFFNKKSEVYQFFKSNGVSFSGVIEKNNEFIVMTVI